MLGPVFRQELLLGGRRYNLHLFRWIYAGGLIVIVVYTYLIFLSEEARIAQARIASGGSVVLTHASLPEVIGARFCGLFVPLQTLLIFLAVPIFTASAVIDEKREGTLQGLLLSELEARHILVGKLLGRMAQLGLWLLVGMPLFALMAGFGGVEPITLLYLGIGLILPVYALTGISLLASVWCQQTRDAVVAVYVLVVFGWVLVEVVGGPLRYLNPLWVLEPAWGALGSQDLKEATRRLILGSLAWGALGTGALLLATLQLTSVYRKEIENVRKAQWFSMEREPVEEDPIGWREQHVEGLAINSTFRRVPSWLAIVLVVILSSAASLLVLYGSMARGATVEEVAQALLQLNVRKVSLLMPSASNWFHFQGVVVLLLASLIVGVRSAGAFAGERERHTWEAVLLTPLSAKQIVRGKLWGILRASSWYLLAYAAPAITFSALAGPYGLVVTLTWLAATGMAMYFMGACGLWCSVRSGSSWRSLLMTKLIGFGGGLVVLVLSAPGIAAVVGILLLMLFFVDVVLNTNLFSVSVQDIDYTKRVIWIAAAGCLAVAWWFLARLFLYRAQRWIADRERTRHPYDEPIYRRSRTGPMPSRGATL